MTTLIADTSEASASAPRLADAPEPTLPPPPAPPPGGHRHVDPSIVVCAAALLLVVLFALVPGVFATHDPLVTNTALRLHGPDSEAWFGYDHLGRDVFSRVVFGSRTTMLATVIAVGIGFAAGSLIGLVSGFVGGRVDDVIMRGVDVLLAIPALLLAMATVTALGFGTLNVAIAVGIGSVASFARVMRAEVLRVRTSTYVEAAFGGGERWWGVLARHVLPNSRGPVIALVSLECGNAVLAVSALSFLGYGVVPPDPEWGSLISEGRSYLGVAWWLTTLPGLVVIAVVLSANRLGRAANRSTGRVS
jgi:peptide/nickel transport system permease protein